MVLNESQYSNSVQKYGKKLTDAIAEREPYLSQRFLMKMCEFVYDDKIPFENVHLLFSKIQEYNLKISNINSLSYKELEDIVTKNTTKKNSLFNNPYYLSSDGMVEIYLIHNYDEVKRLPFSNSWCIKKEGDYNYHAFDKANTMYLIYNKKYSNKSNIRYVMAEVYPKNEEEDEHIIYWATNNDILNGETLTNYINSLGEGISKIQLIPFEESNSSHIPKNSNQLNCNTSKFKKIIRLNESDLYKLIEEAIRDIVG